MSTSALLPLLGSAAGTLAKGAAHSLSNGLSFLTELTSSSEPETPLAAPVADPKQVAANAAVQKFAAKLQQKLASLGVDTEQPLILRESSWGGIEVANDHPQQQAIEQLLTADPALAAEFHTLAQQCRQAAGNDPNPSEYLRKDDFQISIAGAQAASELLAK